jgi:hypothetical protein
LIVPQQVKLELEGKFLMTEIIKAGLDDFERITVKIRAERILQKIRSRLFVQIR